MRAKNETSTQDVVKIFRANNVSVEAKLYCDDDMDAVARNYKEALVDICLATQRPTSKLLESAALLYHQGLEPGAAAHFGQRLAACVSHCRKKAKGATSGCKLDAAVLAIGKAVLQSDSCEGVPARSPEIDRATTSMSSGSRK